MKTLKKNYYLMGAALTVGLMSNVTDAFAAPAGANNFSKIAENINVSISSLPGLLSALAYLFGLVLGVLGIMKIKDHVENPGQTPLKDGAIRLAAGGALFALPIIFEAMFSTIGEGDADVQVKLKKSGFAVE
jgi:hypothetical protein